MSRIRMIMLSMLAVFAMTVASASSASAAKRVWKVCVNVGENNGVFTNSNCNVAGGLKEWQLAFLGAATNITSSGGPYTLKSRAGGAEAKIKCTTQTGEGENIKPGEPGTGEAKNIKFSGCTVEAPTKCIVKEPITTNEISTTLVENPAGTAVEELLSPKAGETFVEIEFKNKGTETCALKNLTFPVKGSVVAQISNSLKAEVKSTLTFEAEKKYKNAAGEEKEAKLTLGPEVATLSGSSTVELASKESVGGF